MNNQCFCSFVLRNKEEVHTVLGDNKVSFPAASGTTKNKQKNSDWLQEESMKDMRRGLRKKSWNTKLSTTTSPKIKEKGEGEKQQGWMGKRAFTDDCSPVWAAKVRTWTSFISLQGHCPRREGSCHPALTSPQRASQLLNIPASQRHGTLWELSKCGKSNRTP